MLRTSGRTAQVAGRLATPGWQPSELLVDGTTVLLVGTPPDPRPGTGPDVPVLPSQARTRAVS